jgi:cytochrome c5
VNKLRLLLVSTFMVSGVAVDAGPLEDAITERITRVGSVCVEGSDCVEGAGELTVASSDASGPAATYKKTCATCHNIGVAGAPKFGDAAQWEPRIAKGLDVLYASSINGMPPGMPAKGMCFNCSDEELKSIVDYMVESSR